MTVKQEIGLIHSEIQTLNKKFDLLIEVLSVGVKAELIEAGNLQALEVAGLLKQTYELRQRERMKEVEAWIKEHKPNTDEQVM